MYSFISSRNRKDVVHAHEAILHGLSRDGGLYTIEPLHTTIDLQAILHKSYQDTALLILSALLDDFSTEELSSSIHSAYDTHFDTPEIVPLHKMQDMWLMELWHGPTCAFKDMALTILPHLMTLSLRKEHLNACISILTATSGDTGKAAIEGFKDVPGTAITVFYPASGVSAIQKMQMVTSSGNNVEVIGVNGNFDDCQRMVKQAASDPEVLSSLEGVCISSANSINIGRLLPQIVYYFTSYAKLVENGEITCGQPVNFVVPTGNFGDILAGYHAKLLGLPVGKLICASNSNHVLTDFLSTGTYSVHRPFLNTISPSMDILISSNLERLLFIESGYSDTFVNTMMDRLQRQGSYQVEDTLLQAIRRTFCGYWTEEDACRKTIQNAFVKEHTLIDPHTAVAVHAAEEYRKETGDTTACIVLSTASPYKFASDVLHCITGETVSDSFQAMQKLEKLTGLKIPEALFSLKDRPVRFTRTIEKEEGMHVIAERMREVGHDHY